mmetsp:Transcript_56720/g.164516  ORF Transcript_56720/g.164516 Transcript_56720/m.164516 type:complete len:250 (+) Transcript_56720:917-1666(+)
MEKTARTRSRSVKQTTSSALSASAPIGRNQWHAFVLRSNVAHVFPWMAVRTAASNAPCCSSNSCVSRGAAHLPSADLLRTTAAMVVSLFPEEPDGKQSLRTRQRLHVNTAAAAATMLRRQLAKPAASACCSAPETASGDEAKPIAAKVASEGPTSTEIFKVLADTTLATSKRGSVSPFCSWPKLDGSTDSGKTRRCSSATRGEPLCAQHLRSESSRAAQQAANHIERVPETTVDAAAATRVAATACSCD